MGLKVIYEDDKLVVADKPAGLTTEQVENELALSGVEGPAHRLDKDTSGVLVLAKTPQALDQLRQEFQLRRVEKCYICLVECVMKQQSGIVHTLLARSPADRRKQRSYSLQEQKKGRREAITQWKVLQRFASYTLLEVKPTTGRKHQIRAHMASIGHPVAGDKLYGFKNQQIPKGLTRQFLHASYLKVNDREFHSTLPEDLQLVLHELKTQNAKVLRFEM